MPTSMLKGMLAIMAILLLSSSLSGCFYSPGFAHREGSRHYEGEHSYGDHSDRSRGYHRGRHRHGENGYYRQGEGD